MKRSELFFSVLLVPVDYFLIVIAGFTAYALRFSFFQEAFPVQYQLATADFARFVFPAAAVWVIFFALLGLYAIRVDIKYRAESIRVFIGSTAAVAFFIFVIFFRQELFASRFIILMSWVLSAVFVMIGRVVIRLIQGLLLKRGIGARSLVVITQPEDEQSVVNLFQTHSELGFRIVEHFSVIDERVREKIHAVNQESGIDDVLLMNPHLDPEALQSLANFCEEEHINFRYTADLFPIPITQFEIGTLLGMPVISLRRTRLEGWGRVWKRIVDVCGASVLLVLTSPFFLIVALGVRLDSPGPIFKKLTRIGERGKPFNLFKFRSMVQNAEDLKKELLPMNERKDGPLFKMQNDPRITRFGKFIRKVSLDELPQFINVIRGEMSLVGPRPHEPQEVALYTSQQKKLLTIKPGMTGLAQISGRSDLKFEQEAKLDIYYIENWKLFLDFSILLKTPSAVFSHKGSA